MKKIYAVRHGETDLNKKECLQGRIDLPLNENGIKQARELGPHIQKLGFCKVYSSPLIRARQTAEISLGPGNIIIDERLTEFGYGRYEGADFSSLDKAMIDFLMHPEEMPSPEGTETIAELSARTGSFISDMRSDPAEAALIFTHGVALRSLFGHLLNNGSAVWGMPIENCTVYEMDLERNTVKQLDI